MPPAMLVLHARPSRLLGGGFSRALRNSITIKMVLGIVLFFAGMSSLYVNHRLGLSLAGVGLVLVFVPAEFLFGLCIDFKGHKENARSRSSSTKSDRQPTEVVVEGDGKGVATVLASGTLPAEAAQGEGGGSRASSTLQEDADDAEDYSSGENGRPSFPRCSCPARSATPETAVQLHRTTSVVLRGGGASTAGEAGAVVTELQDLPDAQPRLLSGDSRFPEATSAAAVKTATNPSPAACKFHRTRSAVLRTEDLPKNTPPQVVRFSIGSEGEKSPATISSRPVTVGGSDKTKSGQAPIPKSGPSLVRGASVEQTRFHRSKSAIVHRGSLSGEDPTTPSPLSSTKSSPTRSARAGQGQSPNSSPFKERPQAPGVVRVQQLQQLQPQIPNSRVQSNKVSSTAVDSRAPVMTVQLYVPPSARLPFSDLSNENYTRFHRIRAAAQQQQQQQQLQQQQATAAAIGLAAAAKRREAMTSQNLLLRTRSMTSSRSSTNLSQPPQESARAPSKLNKDKALSATQEAKGSSSSSADTSRNRSVEPTTPKLRRTSSGPSRRPARTNKEPVPWTSLAVQTAAGVIALLCKPQGLDAADLLAAPRQADSAVGERGRRGALMLGPVKVSVRDADSSVDREDNASPGASGKRDSSSSLLAQPSST
ncbi:uncharacterized protein LOC144148449 [Haemaphysalis longicornis]